MIKKICAICFILLATPAVATGPGAEETIRYIKDKCEGAVWQPLPGARTGKVLISLPNGDIHFENIFQFSNAGHFDITFVSLNLKDVELSFNTHPDTDRKEIAFSCLNRKNCIKKQAREFMSGVKTTDAPPTLSNYGYIVCLSPEERPLKAFLHLQELLGGGVKKDPFAN